MEWPLKCVGVIRSETDRILLLSLFFLLFFYLCWRPLQKKAEGSVVSNRIGMKFGRTVLQVNMHRLIDRVRFFEMTS